ncbi:MAG TPA: hypothetical protein VJR89_01680, partial [Polyangiales bacterium]|nr:hypothetical protein [Polyangiales bacterium]
MPIAEHGADPGADAEYADEIRAAVEHYSARRWSEAHAAFARAHALQPSARTFRGLGLAAFYLEQYAAARQAFEQALADPRRPLPPEQREELGLLIHTAARESGRFELHVEPAAAQVELDGALTEQRVLFLARGEHVLSVRAADHAAQRTVLKVAGGEDRMLMLVLAREPVPGAGLASSAAATAREQSPEATPARARVHEPTYDVTSRHEGGRFFTWIAAGAVPVFAGTAAAIWFTGDAKRDQIERDCAKDGCDAPEARRRWDDANIDAHQTWTRVSLVAAGVALVAAPVLFVVEGAGSSPDRVKLVIAPSGGGLGGR